MKMNNQQEVILMKIKKITSLILSFMMIFTVVCGCFAFSANAAGTITYSYVISTTEEINAFEGTIYYPSASLSVNSVSFGGQWNDKGGKIPFNNSNVQTPFDFEGGKTMITVVFNVNGAYDASALYGELDEFYNIATVASGNSPFDYTNVIDGEVASSGHTDIDTPANSYSDTKYSVVYTYNESPSNSATYTKTVWAHSDNALTIAENNKPNITNPYYQNYSATTASFNGNIINAALTGEFKEYSISLNGVDVDQKHYLDSAEVAVGSECDFFINGNRVYRGTSYSFFVTGDTNITTEVAQGDIIDSAALVSNALYVSESNNTPYVKMELLASTTSKNYARMGVAFASEEKTIAQLSSAINAVTANTAASNKIAVHNSSVNMPNKSGQYQFIYAPYVAVSKISKDTSLYFYSFVVNTDGDVTISDVQQVNFANVLA